MSTGSNGNENPAGSDPEESRARRVSGAGSAWDPAPGVWRPQASGSAGQDDAVRQALLRARRAGSAPAAGVFALDAGPEPEPGDLPLRSRGGGVNKPRAAVPTPLLAAEAVRLVDAAHTKRARMVTAIGVPAAFLAATGVAVMPTVANAASTSSNSSTPTASSANCAPGSSAVANPAAKAGAPTSSASAPTSAPSSGSAKPNTPGVPLPTSAPTSPQPSAPSARPSSAPSGTTTTAPAQPAPTSTPTAPAPSSTSTQAAPSGTPSPSSSPTWWDPLSWLGTTVNGVFNPAPSSSSSNSTVNKLAAPAAGPSSNPTSSPTPILSIGLGGSSSSPSPSGTPTSKPSAPLPSTPQPTSSGSDEPSTPAASSASPSSTSTPSGGATTVQMNGQSVTLPTTAPSTVCVTPAADQPFREVEWHLDASSLTLYHQKFLGFQQIHTGDGRTVTVMAVHADSIDLTDMVTYNEDGNPRVYSNGGKGKNVHLTNVTLHVLQQKGTLVAPLPLGPVTLGPPGESGNDLGSILAMGALELNISLGPTVMTDVHVDQYLMTSDTLSIPGFNVRSAG